MVVWSILIEYSVASKQTKKEFVLIKGNGKEPNDFLSPYYHEKYSQELFSNSN